MNQNIAKLGYNKHLNGVAEKYSLYPFFAITVISVLHYYRHFSWMENASFLIFCRFIFGLFVKFRLFPSRFNPSTINPPTIDNSNIKRKFLEIHRHSYKQIIFSISNFTRYFHFQFYTSFLATSMTLLRHVLVISVRMSCYSRSYVMLYPSTL